MRYLVAGPATAVPDRARLRPAAGAVEAGGLVLFPTETVYGIGASLRHPDALARLTEAKQRANQPWLVHCANVEQALALVRKPGTLARKLMERFWPGPLALVLRAGPGLPGRVTAATGTVGIRVVSVPTTRAFIEELGRPLIGASANIRSRPATNCFGEIDRPIVRSCRVVIDAGTCGSGRASTVVDVTCYPPRVLRAGAVSIQAMESVLGRSVSFPGP